MNPVSSLTAVDEQEPTPVELVGHLHSDVPLQDPAVPGRFAVHRVLLGYLIPVTRSSGGTSTTVTTLKVVRRKTRVAPGLHVRTPDGVLRIDADQIDLTGATYRSRRCERCPEGFEDVLKSPLASQGPLGRGDIRLLEGDRVEVVGRAQRVGGEYRVVGKVHITDLSLGQATSEEERRRSHRLERAVIVGVAVLFVGLLALFVFGN